MFFSIKPALYGRLLYLLKKNFMQIKVKDNIFLNEQSYFVSELNLVGTFKKFTKADQKRVHNAALKKIGEIFNEDFGRFIIKNNKFKRFGSKAFEIARMIQLAKQGNEKALDNIEFFIVNNMIAYYKSKIKTKLLKKAITGSKMIDNAYLSAFEAYISSESVRGILKQQADNILAGKSDDILDIVLEKKERKSLKKSFRDIRNALSPKMKRIKYQITDAILDEFSDLNKTIKREIKKGIDERSDEKTIELYEQVVESRNKIKYIVDSIAEPTLSYVSKYVLNKHFQDIDFRGFNGIIISLLESEDFEKAFKKKLLTDIKISKM